MTDYRKMTENSFRFKPQPSTSDPFPPSYYECEKRAKELLAQIQNPKLLKLQR